MGPFKLLDIKDEICKFHLLSGLTKFKSTVIKSYLIDNENTENSSLTPAKISLLAQNLLSDTSPLPLTKTSPMPPSRPFQIQ